MSGDERLMKTKKGALIVKNIVAAVVSAAGDDVDLKDDDAFRDLINLVTRFCNISVAEVAEACGVTYPTVSRWRNGAFPDRAYRAYLAERIIELVKQQTME